IIVNAFITAVTSPPFLNRLPFADAMTSGLTAFCSRIIGKPETSVLVAANVKPATAPVRMKSRRFIFFVMVAHIQSRCLIKFQSFFDSLGRFWADAVDHVETATGDEVFELRKS